MWKKAAVLLAAVGMLSACGHTPEERLVSGALIGGLAGATVGVLSDPHRHDRHYHGHHGHRRHGYKHRRHHRRHHGGW